jgi:hypothetical protein
VTDLESNGSKYTDDLFTPCDYSIRGDESDFLPDDSKYVWKRTNEFMENQ